MKETAKKIKGWTNGGTKKNLKNRKQKKQTPCHTEHRSSCLERPSGGFSFEGRWVFTYTDESASLGCNCPREPPSAAVTGKKEQQPWPAGSPRALCCHGRPSPEVMRGSRVPGTGTQQKAVSNASALLTQGVSSGNSGFLTPQACTSPPGERDGRKAFDGSLASKLVDRQGDRPTEEREHPSPSAGLPGTLAQSCPFRCLPRVRA